MANDTTSKINAEPSSAIKTLGCSELQQVDFGFAAPFQLQLNDKQIFIAQKILRLIPRRRMVVLGTWQGKTVIGKLFFDAQHAQKQAEKELAGLKILQQNKIPTPALYYHGNAGRTELLVMEYIEAAESLETIWQRESKALNPAFTLHQVMIELATQHVLGVVQRDLHLNNFLITPKIIYTVDGGGIVQEQQLLPKKASIHNIALFLSQLGVGHEELQVKLFKDYAKSRGWLVKGDDLNELKNQIRKWNDVRWASFSKKIFREGSHFAVHKKNGYQGVYKRRYGSEEFLKILQDPDSAFTDPRAELLKNGRSATVIKLKLDDQWLLIKRYNMKNFLNRLRRYFRSTRAFNAWRMTNKLDLFCVPVPKPVAYLEERFLGLHTRSYFFSECLEGMNLGDYVKIHRENEDSISTLAARVSRLLKNIGKLNIAHRDLKETNVWLVQGGEPVLIDYDAATEYSSVNRLKHALKRDVNRLLKNFRHDPMVTKKFKEVL